MKKILSVILVLLMFCSMVACDNIGKSFVENTKFNTEPFTEGTPLVTESATRPATEPSTNNIRADFKAAMDSYEAFFDDYVAIMKKYKENPTDLSILADYAKYMGQYADRMQKFEQWENEDLNAAELAYYVDVQAKITRKLLEIA